jgi:RalA-binding protein 1
LPAIVFRCIEYLEAKKAAEEEGIYRLSGSSAVIKALKDRFNHGKFFWAVLKLELMKFLFD